MKTSHVILFIVIFFMAIALYYGLRNYNGYCSALGRALTDQEKYEIAVQYINSDLRGVDVQDECPPEGCRPIPYKDVEDFFKKNPECCSTVMKKTKGDSAPPRTFYSRIFGLHVGFVEVTYNAMYLTPEGVKKQTPKSVRVNFGNCGENNN